MTNTINILILIGGKGTRFADAGYQEPKPLIKANGKSLLELSVECLKPTKHKHRHVFVCSPEQYKDFEPEIKRVSDNYVIAFDDVLRGMAPGCLMALDYIDNDDPLIIASCDQFLEWDFDSFLDFALKTDGCMPTFKGDSDSYSYCKTENNLVTEVAEKRKISDDANIGIYFFKKGRYFVKSALKMISKEIKVDNQYYLAPVYNEMLDKIVRIYPIGNDQVHILGTPKELEAYIDYTKTTSKIS